MGLTQFIDNVNCESEFFSFFFYYIILYYIILYYIILYYLPLSRASSIEMIKTELYIEILTIYIKNIDNKINK